MKSAMWLATLFFLTCLPGHAYEVETGSITICDTQKQVERFVQLFDENPQVAMSAVNAEENNPNACAEVDVSYVQAPNWAWPGADRMRSRSSRSWWSGQTCRADTGRSSRLSSSPSSKSRSLQCDEGERTTRAFTRA